jgi:hypothetical protein
MNVIGAMVVVEIGENLTCLIAKSTEAIYRETRLN